MSARDCAPHVADGRDYWFIGGLVVDEIAKAICSGCAGRNACAIAGRDEPWGIFGGLTVGERLGSMLLATPGPEPKKHGTRGRYSMGCHCDACTEANTQWMNDYRDREPVAVTATARVDLGEQLDLLEIA